MSLTTYTVTTTGINGENVRSTIELFVPTGYPGLECTVCFSGKAKNLAKNLDPDDGDCVDPNGCGVHVHSGTSCADSEGQGGHYYSSDLPMDPWSEIRYPGTNGNGIAKFGACVDVGYDLSDGALVGKAFVVHKNNGGRVSCGIIEEVTTSSSKNKKSSKSRR